MKNKQNIRSDVCGIFLQIRGAACAIIKEKNATYCAIGLRHVTMGDRYTPQ